MTILLTYWCRTGSVDWLQRGFLTRITCLLGVYELIMYGPSDIMCWRMIRLSGTKLSYSTGRAELNGMARMYRKSAAGCTRRNTSVEEFGVEIPEMLCVFWKFVMLAAVGLWVLK